MALAPWDLVSWHSLSDTGSLGEPLNTVGVRRESYLRATRTPTFGCDRSDSLRLSRACSISMTTPSRQQQAGPVSKLSNNSNSNGGILNRTGSKAAMLGIGIEQDPPSGVSEVFQTPSGEVSLVITDHSTTSNNNQPNGTANGGTGGGTKSPPASKVPTGTAPSKKLTTFVKLTTESTPLKVQSVSNNKDSLKNDQKPKESTMPDPSDDELYIKKKRKAANGTKVEPTLGEESEAKAPDKAGEDDEEPTGKPERPPYLSRDIFVLCIVFIFAFSAVRAVQVLQSSVNDKGKLGTLALSIFYASLALTVIFFPPVFHNRLSDRTSLCLGIFLLFVWLISNLVPYPLLLLPAAMLGGAGLTLSWTAQMNAFASYFRAETSQKSSETEKKLSLKRFLLTNNTLFALFQSSHIWGNLSVAVILLAETRPDDPNSPFNSAITVKIVPATNRTITYNRTIGPGWYFFPPLFRVDLTPALSNEYDDLWSKCRKDVDNFPSSASWVSLISFSSMGLVQFPAAWALAWLVALGFIALLLAALFFHPNPVPKNEANNDDENDEEDPLEFEMSTRVQKYIVAHMFQLFDGPHFRLLIPLLFFNGLEQGFLYTDYTKIYLSCMFGLSSVGVAVMVSGVISCVFSAMASFAAKRSVSREVIISIAAIVHLALACFLYQWAAYPSIPILVFIIPVIYGFCDAVWQTTCYVLITKVAGEDHQLAFSNFRILQSLGIATSCILSFVAGLGLKVSVLVVNLLLAVLCYAILENRIRREELAAKDRERLANAFKQLTMVMGAAGIRPRALRMPPINPRASAHHITKPIINNLDFDYGNHIGTLNSNHKRPFSPLSPRINHGPFRINDLDEEIL